MHFSCSKKAEQKVGCDIAIVVDVVFRASSLDETLPNTKCSIRRTIWGPKNADVPGLQNQPHEMAFRHCLSTFVPYPLRGRERERNRGRINRRPKTAMEWRREERAVERT